MLVKIYSGAVQGVDAHPIEIEVDVAGAFGFSIVGLPDSAVRESRDRVNAAIRNSKFDFPLGKITINLAPADIKKEGSGFDLPIALGILAASKQIKQETLDRYLFSGELALDGIVKPVKGALPLGILARKKSFPGLILPAENAGEASIVNELEVIPVTTLKETVDFLNGKCEIHPVKTDTRRLFDEAQENDAVDFSEVKGQENIKRALEVAAAGGHNVIMIGPPGAGKTMLARRLPAILPSMTLAEALETTKIHSVAGKLSRSHGLVARRPFRAPHHTISDVALVGGGTIPQPGEISQAHNGVLFLDELPEFKRQVLEVLRQPLEERRITISRARVSVEYPANFMLVASMNPCPCGYYNHPEKTCMCNTQQVHKYLAKISGPLMDRIDIQIEVTPVKIEELATRQAAERSVSIRERVLRAREIQRLRFGKEEGVYCNAMMSSGLTRKFCDLDSAGNAILKQAMQRLGLSARAYERILRVSRTVADLANSENILPEHLAEAIQYRSLDRSNWAG